MDNIAGLDVQANGTPVMHALNGKRNISSVEATWVRGTTDSSMVKEPKPEKAANIQLGDNVAGIDIQANGTPVRHALALNDVGGVRGTWERGTTNMVDDNGKVADPQRKMVNNPERSRKEWAETRKESRKIAAEQHH